MKIAFPPRNDGSFDSLPDNVRKIVIVGANGAGKTRFSNKLENDIKGHTFRLSALRALYERDTPAKRNSDIDRLYARSGAPATLMPESSLELDSLLSILMHDEMINLIGYKVALSSNPQAQMQPTKLDKVISLWQEVFPDNKILIETGKMLFSRRTDDESYSALKLSDGEKAVMYYIGATLYAPKNSVIFIDSPEYFLHPSILQSLWNRIEIMRRDCLFVYTTHDLEFASSRTNATTIWVRSYSPESNTWDYDLLLPQSSLTEEMYLTIIGARKPVMFIEGDGVHSIDSKLYPLVFKDYTVKALGSCNKVIEATRTFNDLNSFHHMDSCGIVDRDRRDAFEVAYLRRKKIMVPDVAEIENILMLEEVVRTVAKSRNRNEDKAFERVRRSLISMFRQDIHQQALLHTRHKVKRTVEYRIDGRFTDIGMLERHLDGLRKEINPRGLYEDFCREFHRYVDTADYRNILRVYNQKSMIPGSNVAALCGLKNKEDYIKTILNILSENGPGAERIRRAVTDCFDLGTDKNEEQ